jgi:hypothetical protein
MGRRILPFAFVAVAVLLVAGIATSPGTSLALFASATPAAVDHPVHIHDGTCANLGGIAYPLTDLKHGAMMGSPMAGMKASPMAGMASPMAGMKAGEEVESASTTTVKVSLADLLKEKYAINAHESPAKIQVYIACGDITGTPKNNELTIQLKEENSSGVHGWAMLKDNGDGTTTVDVALVGMHGVMGTPKATPKA